MAEKHVRDLVFKWGRQALSRVVHFGLDRLLELDDVLEDSEGEDDWLAALELETLRDMGRDSQQDVVSFPLKPMPLDSRWPHSVDESELHIVRFIDAAGADRFRLMGQGPKEDLVTMTLSTEPWPNGEIHILGLRIYAVYEEGARGMIQDLHLDFDTAKNLLPSNGWMFMDAFTPKKRGYLDLPALADYPVLPQDDRDVEMMMTIGVWGEGVVTGEAALIVRVTEAYEEDEIEISPDPSAA